MISAVVDPSVLVSAFLGREDAAPGRLITAFREKRFVLIVSPEILDELEDVLGREKFAKWASDDRGTEYIAGLSARGDHHPDPPDAPSVVRDPNDDYLVALARATKADALVSVDKDLLDLKLNDLTVYTPRAFVDKLAAEEGNEPS